MVPKLAILKDVESDEQVQKIATRVCNALIELDKIQLELSLQIADFQLKAHPSTPPEVKEKQATTITNMIAMVYGAVENFTWLFEQFFEVLASLQEDPNLQWLETEA